MLNFKEQILRQGTFIPYSKNSSHNSIDKQKFDWGAFYTPTELTHWMVDFVEKLCEQNFDGKIQQCASRVIDPCCGTGGFLEALARKIDADEEVKPQIVGLEVLPATICTFPH